MPDPTDKEALRLALMEAEALEYEPLSDEEFTRAQVDAEERRQHEWRAATDAYVNACNATMPVLKVMQEQNELALKEALYWKARCRRAEQRLAALEGQGGSDV